MVLPYIIHHRCTRVPHPEPPSHLPPGTIPLGHPSTPAPSILYPASNLDWRFISYMIVYRFQCYFSKSSHPLPLPQSSKDFYTSVSLLLSRIQGYRYHLSKFHICVLVYCIGVFFFFWLTSLCIIGSSFIHLIRRSTYFKKQINHSGVFISQGFCEDSRGETWSSIAQSCLKKDTRETKDPRNECSQ